MKKDYLNSIKKINRMEVPPFLFTRIEAKIQEVEESKISEKWKLVTGFVFTFVIVVNILFISTLDFNKINTSTEVVDSMNINLSNQLYHE